jgi:aldehyde:ferredoxin oxidoreductase
MEVNPMPYGYNGQILRIDLTSGQMKTEQPGESFFRHYWGGRGFIGYYLLREMSAGTQPLGPDNLLIFATGVLTGGAFGGSGRHSVGARSPLTGAFGEAEAGGYWGAELKRAGYDALVISGCAPRPAYLWIHDGKAEILDATHLWGLDTGDARDRLVEEHGDKAIRVALIGPGGENKVRFACITHDLKHAAGRTGLGAVMGSKNLKAIAVRGDSAPAPADPERVQSVARWLSQAVEDNAGLMGLRLNGTAGLVSALNALGALPTRNFREGVFESRRQVTPSIRNMAGRNTRPSPRLAPTAAATIWAWSQ